MTSGPRLEGARGGTHCFRFSPLFPFRTPFLCNLCIFRVNHTAGVLRVKFGFYVHGRGSTSHVIHIYWTFPLCIWGFGLGMGKEMGWVGMGIHPDLPACAFWETSCFSTRAFDTNGWEAGLDLHML